MVQWVFSTRPLMISPNPLNSHSNPDLFNSPAAHVALKLINKAWAVLGDVTRREIHVTCMWVCVLQLLLVGWTA